MDTVMTTPSRQRLAEVGRPVLFVLDRHDDVTKVSGPGFVAYGCVFSDGTTVVHWCVPGKPSSTVIFDSPADMLEIHGHDGKTEMVAL